MSLTATLFMKSCADGGLAGGVWEKATEANSPQPTARIRVLFLVALPGCITA
jgi:hypothetical protein